MTHSSRWHRNKCVRIYTQWIFFRWPGTLSSATWVLFLHDYTYMAGDTKLSSREMLACGGSWPDASKSFPRWPSAAPRTGAAPPFRAPEVSSSRSWSDRDGHVCPHDFRGDYSRAANLRACGSWIEAWLPVAYCDGLSPGGLVVPLPGAERGYLCGHGRRRWFIQLHGHKNKQDV